jgi:hypothetical protein
MIQEWFAFLRKDILGTLPEINAGWIALLSGLFGAVITAIFNYFINIRLAKREQKRKEQRIAYVYLVKVSDVVATDLVLRKVFLWELKRIDPDNTLQKLRSQLKNLSEKIDAAHGACAILANALNESDSDAHKKLRDAFQLMSGSEKSFDEVLGFQLPEELLVQLPRESVIHYSLFIKNILDIKRAFNLWLHWTKTGDRNLLNANTLYSHWSTIKDISTNARKLRDILIEKGRVSPHEADNLLNLQQTKLSEGIKDFLYAGKVMEILSKMYKKAEEKKLSQTLLGENITASSPTPTLSSKN